MDIGLSTGTWYGDLGSNGYTRETGLAMTGGSEFVVLSKNGQGSTLVDGAYLAYESANGFFGSYNSSYGNLTGIQATAANTLTVKQLDGGTANLAITSIANATTDTDKFLVSNSGVVQYRTGAEVLGDIGAQASGNYLPVANPTFTGTLTGPTARITSELSVDGAMLAGNTFSDPDLVLTVLDTDTTQSIRDKINDTTSITKVSDSTAPAPGVFAVNGSNYPQGFGPFYTIDEGDTFTFEFWVKKESGAATSCLLYAGSNFYNSSGTYLGNSQRYWGESALQVAAFTDWYHVSGTLGPQRGSNTGDIPTTAVSMRLLFLFNYNANASIVTHYCGLKVYKSSKTVTQLYRKTLGSEASTTRNRDLVVDANGDLYGSKINATDNVTFAAGLQVTSPGSAFYNRFRSGNDYVIGLQDSLGDDEWWLKAYTNGAFALHENNVGDKFTIAAGGNATFSDQLTISTISNAVSDTDKFLVSDSGVIKYRTGAQVLSDIGAASSGSLGNYLLLAGGTMSGTIVSTATTALEMDGAADAQGVLMQADSSGTYPVFLRSLNPSSGGETSPWLYKEASTPWGIWHNNPVNSFDFTRSGNNLGIANNVGGQTNSVMIRLTASDGSGTFAGNISAGSGTFSAFVYAEDEIHLTDAGTTRAKLLLNSSDRDNVELRAESLGSTMKFFTVGTEALELDASQNATFAGNVNLPANKYILIGTDSGDAFNTSSAIRVQDTSHAYVQMKVGNSSQGGFLIGNTTDDYLGGFTYSNSSESLIFKTANTDALTITGAGNATFAGDITAGRIVTSGLYGTGHSGSILPIWQYNAGNPGYGIGYEESSPDKLRMDVSNNLMSGTPDFELIPNELRINGNKVWNAGNDGAGSGLDADLLDGQNGSYYASASSLGNYLPLAGGTMTGNITLPGEENNTFKIGFTGASATSGLSTVDQSGAGLYIGANSKLNNSGVVVYNNSALPSSGIYFDGWNGDDMEFYTGASGTPVKRLTISSAGSATFTGDVNVNGNTFLGNANGDYVHVNDKLYVGATDSGNADFWFGEGTTGDVNYGARWYWDSSYTHQWYTVNNSSETLMMSYATNDTSKVQWFRNFDMNNNKITELATPTADADAVNKEYVDDNAAPYVKFSRAGINSSTYTMIATVNGDNLASILKMTMTGTSGNVVFACTFDITVNHYQDIHVKSMNGDYTEVTLRITSDNNEDYSIEAKHNGSTTTNAEVCIFPLAAEIITPTTTDPGYTGAEYIHTAIEGWRYGGEDGNVESSNVVVDGKIGIGKSNPQVPLDVEGKIRSNDSNSGDYLEIFCDGSVSGDSYIENTNNNIQIKSAFATSFSTSGSVAMFIKDNQNVGIGTTGPSTKLHVAGTTLLRTSNGVADLYLGNNATGNFARFHTNNSNTYFDMNCGVVYWRQGSGTRFQHNMTSGTFTASGDLVAYGSPSDVRLKENVKPIESALDKVSKLQGVTFDWKKSDSILDIKEDIGFIAQDVQKVVPELVRENEDGMLSMRHQGIAPILLEAIKELKAEIEELKSKNCNCNK